MYNTVVASVKTVRAVGVELAWRLLKPMLIAGVAAAIGLLGIGGWLTTQHALWWILEFAFITSVLFFALLSAVTIFILRRLEPTQDKTQKKAVRDFADKLQRVADAVGISRFLLLFRVVRDVIWPNEQTFIKQITDDSTTLHTDFLKLQKLFESKQ